VTRGRPTQSRDAGGRAPSALTVSNKDNPKAMCIYRFRLHTVERLVTHNSPLQQQRCIFPWFWPATQPPPRIARRPRSYAGQPAGRGNHLLAALTAAVEPRRTRAPLVVRRARLRQPRAPLASPNRGGQAPAASFAVSLVSRGHVVWPRCKRADSEHIFASRVGSSPKCITRLHSLLEVILIGKNTVN
jgi:hypothetical protein